MLILEESLIHFLLIKNNTRLVGGLKNTFCVLNMDTSFQCLCSNLTSRQFERQQYEGRRNQTFGSGDIFHSGGLVR